MKGLWKEIAVGVLILAAAGLLGYMSIRVGSLRTPGARSFVAYFDDAAGLVQNAPVTAAGIKVGSVSGLAFENGRARVTLSLQPEIQVRDDASATIRARSLLGEKYVALDPGESGEKLDPGSEIPTHPSADMDRLIAAVATLAESADPEDIQGLLHGLNELLNTTAEDGKSIPEAIAEITSSMSRLTAKAERLADEGTALSRRMGPAIDDVEELTQQLKKTLEKADPAVEELPESVARLNRVLTRMENLLEQNEDLSKESIVDELRKIVTQEGVYVRLKPRKKK